MSIPPILPSSPLPSDLPSLGGLDFEMFATPATESFADLLVKVGKGARDRLKQAESSAKAAARGEADPQQVALDVVNAKASFHQLTALGRACLQAYKEVMQMGI